MNVTCPNCNTVYRVDPAKVPEAGVRARCAVCSAVFAVRRDGQPEAAPSVHREAPTPAAEPRTSPPASAPPAAPPPSQQAAAAAEIAAPHQVERAAAAAPPPAQADAPRAVPPTAPPLAPPPQAPAPAAAEAPPRAPVTPPVPPASPPARSVVMPPPAMPRPGGAGRTSGPAPGAPLPPPAAPVSAAPAPVAPRPVNPFLAQDPSAKARRLARALISDMVVYHPGKRQEGLRDGTLKQLFEEEIRKSWEEYLEQVGAQVAESTPHFRDALNEILADGKQIF